MYCGFKKTVLFFLILIFISNDVFPYIYHTRIGLTGENMHTGVAGYNDLGALLLNPANIVDEENTGTYFGTLMMFIPVGKAKYTTNEGFGGTHKGSTGWVNVDTRALLSPYVGYIFKLSDRMAAGWGYFGSGKGFEFNDDERKFFTAKNFQGSSNLVFSYAAIITDQINFGASFVFSGVTTYERHRKDPNGLLGATLGSGTATKLVLGTTYQANTDTRFGFTYETGASIDVDDGRIAVGYVDGNPANFNKDNIKYEYSDKKYQDPARLGLGVRTRILDDVIVDVDWHYVFYKGLSYYENFDNAHGIFVDFKKPILDDTVVNFGFAVATLVYSDSSRKELSFEHAYNAISRDPAVPYMMQVGIKNETENRVLRFSFLYAFNHTEKFKGTSTDSLGNIHTIEGENQMELYRIGFSTEFKF